MGHLAGGVTPDLRDLKSWVGSSVGWVTARWVGGGW